MRRLTFLLVPALAVSMATAAPAAPSEPPPRPPGPVSVSLSPLGTYASGIFDQSAAEIVAHDPGTQRLFVVNAAAAQVDVLDIADAESPNKIATLDVTVIGAGANSVAVANGLVAVAVEAATATESGSVAFFDAAAATDPDLTPLAVVDVGALPDMVTFTPDGTTVLVANEGEPGDAYDVDPEGTVSVIDLPRDITALTNDDVRTADFTAWNDGGTRTLHEDVRIFGPGASVAQDLEPEYVAVAADNRSAFVALQENNAVAVLDVAAAEVTDILPMGFKDHSEPGNELDPSDRDGQIAIGGWPVNGMFQPDAIATYDFRGQSYVVTANEGDARDYEGFAEEARVGDLELCPDVFDEAIQAEDQLGRLTVTTTRGLRADASCYEDLYAFGGRSFSIVAADGTMVYDSGADFESTIANLIDDGTLPTGAFNANNDDTDSFDTRSDAKGPEPEAVTLGKVAGRTYAFVGLERIGGIMVYDVTDPRAPFFMEYVTTRAFDGDAEAGTAGDLGPEGIVFIAAGDSPTGDPMLAIGNEVSGTTTLYDITLATPGRGPR